MIARTADAVAMAGVETIRGRKMAKLILTSSPKYSHLPVKAGAPAHSNWGVFGDDDEIGCFNFLGPEGIVDAAKLIRDGKAFRLDSRIGYADPPIGGRATGERVRQIEYRVGRVDLHQCD